MIIEAFFNKNLQKRIIDKAYHAACREKYSEHEKLQEAPTNIERV